MGFRSLELDAVPLAARAFISIDSGNLGLTAWSTGSYCHCYEWQHSWVLFEEFHLCPVRQLVVIHLSSWEILLIKQQHVCCRGTSVPNHCCSVLFLGFCSASPHALSFQYLAYFHNRSECAAAPPFNSIQTNLMKLAYWHLSLAIVSSSF